MYNELNEKEFLFEIINLIKNNNILNYLIKNLREELIKELVKEWEL